MSWQKVSVFLTTLGLSAIAVTGMACGDDDGEAEAESVRASIDAINQASLELDSETFLKYVTEDGLENVFFTTEEEVREDPMSGFGSESEDDFFVVDSIKVDGAKAEVSERPADGQVLIAPGALDMIKEDGVWKVDGAHPLDAEKPKDAVTVPVKLMEFGFEIDDSRLEAGKPVLFEVENGGEQPHHFGLFKLAADVDLEEALASEDETPGIEEVGFVGTWKPGASSDVALTQPLEAGRYAFICFLSDTSAPNPGEAPPHFALGMVHEVTVD